MEAKVDARGRSCPEPVLMTKQFVEKNAAAEFEVWVDTEVAKDNVTRFLQNKGYNVTIKEHGEEISLIIKK